MLKRKAGGIVLTGGLLCLEDITGESKQEALDLGALYEQKRKKKFFSILEISLDEHNDMKKTSTK